MLLQKTGVFPLDSLRIAVMTMNPERLPAGSSASPRAHALGGNALAAAAMMTWAAGFPAAEVLLQTWPPVMLLAARLLLAAVGILLLWGMREGVQTVLRAPWRKGLMIGIFGFGASAYLIIQAQVLTNAVTAALICSAAPVIGGVLEMLQGQRRLGVRFALGAVATVIGGIIATSSLSGAELGLGAAAAAAAITLYTWASSAAVRELPDLSPSGRSAVTICGGLILASVLTAGTAALGGEWLPSAPVDGYQLQMLLIFGLVSVMISQLLWLSAVERLGVALASFHTNLAPFYVMILMLFLGESWEWPQAIGAAVVGLGVIVAQDKRPKLAEPVNGSQA